ncbi:MAG: hypothetical protein HZY79_02080 [Rhodoblastus sp.]|nr:MAG: hypothetical protein HZY79_02080 [Rhodoblastus sp.]
MPLFGAASLPQRHAHGVRRRRRGLGPIALAALGASVAGAPNGSAAPLDQFPLAAPFDVSMYRDDAVRLVETVHGEWRVKCKEIIPLRRRFCNIMAPLRNTDGRVEGSFLISTDRSGKPGVLMRILTPLVVGRPTVVATRFEARAKARAVPVVYRKS